MLNNDINKYKLTSYNELMAKPLKPAEWVLEGLIPKVGVSLLAGDGGIGKSWLALHLAQCIASGNKFLGTFPVTQGKVLIIDEENHETLIRERCEKLHLGTPIINRDLNIHISANTGINIDDANDFEWLMKTVKEICPTLVIIDSLIRVHTKDENSANEMQEVLHQAKRLAEDGNTSVLFTHHTSKPYQGRQRTSVRGSTDIRNFVDSVLFVYKKGQHKVVEHDKSRWGTPIKPFGFEIADIDVGVSVRLNIVDISLSYQRESKWAEAEKLIFSLVKNGAIASRKEIIAAGKSNRPYISETTMDKNLSRLVKAGKLDSSGGDGKNKLYSEKIP